MAQQQTIGQRIKQAPSKMLLSTMIQSADQELEQLIRKEVSENVALEIVDPGQSDYDGSEADSAFEGGSDDAYGDDAPQTPSSADGALTDDERGEKVEIHRDDDDVVDTSSRQHDATESDGPDIFSRTVSEVTAREDLKKQIDLLDITREERYLAHYLIDCLDSDGYLRRSLDELVDDLEFVQQHVTTYDDLESVLVEILQENLEPTGIGARDLRECLMLQALELKATPAHRLAYMVLDQAFDELVDKHYDTIQQRFGITNHQAWVEVMRTIRHLNPRPGNLDANTGNNTSEDIAERIHPDFFVTNEDGQLVVTLNDGDLPQVRISAEQEAFYDQLQTLATGKPATATDKENREGMRFMRDSIQRAQTFIDCLEQRRSTMLEVMKTIVRMQRAFFLTGQVETLRPMTLEDVESQCAYDKSTISRVTSTRHADTEWGTIALKSLFTNAVGDATQTAIIDALRNIIDEEDKQHPFTDDALVVELARLGYSIARRTVVKYRMHLGYGSARERRQA